jgi:hypothetical protein
MRPSRLRTVIVTSMIFLSGVNLSALRESLVEEVVAVEVGVPGCLNPSCPQLRLLTIGGGDGIHCLPMSSIVKSGGIVKGNGGICSSETLRFVLFGLIRLS